MKRFVIAIIPIVALALGAAAPERNPPLQDTLDQSDDYMQRNVSTPEARQAIESYGQCVARREPGEAHRLLTMDFKNSRYRTGLRLLADEAKRACAYDSFGRGVMRSAGLLFSGAMAEALLETRPEPLNVRLVRSANAKAKSYSLTDAVALCVARSMPDQVGALFATKPGSEAEALATAALNPAIAPCARAVGIAAKLELSVPALRAMVATASYRLLASSEDGDA